MKNWLYIGGEAALEQSEIVGVFDLDNTSWAIDSRKFLNNAERDGRVRNTAEDLPKSFVVTRDDEIILAQPNTAILAKRWENDQ